MPSHSAPTAPSPRAATPVAPSTLSSPRAAALYVGALLGPSVLLLPGLAASLAGPASLLVWAGLLVVSGALAVVFSALGSRLPGADGAAGYVAAAFGTRAGRVVGVCFLAGVVAGAPVVCLIGGTYLARMLGGGHTAAVVAAAGLLALVVALNSAGTRVSTGAQLALVAVLVALVVLAVTGSLPAARAAHWTPFLPHGWSSLGSTAAVLMLSFVGWEAIAPLTARLRDPARQLPVVIGTAFVVTSAVYLGLAVAVVAVLGPAVTGEVGQVPLAGLLAVAVGPAGSAIAAVAAVALTLAATNAYLSGATALAAALRDAPTAPAPARVPDDRAVARRIRMAIAVLGAVLLGGSAAGFLDTADLVALPTTLFLTVYLGATAAGARLLRGSRRIAAGFALAAVTVVLASCGWWLAAPVVVIAGVVLGRPQRPQP